MARKRLLVFGIPAWLVAVGAALWWRGRGSAAAARLKEQISTDETRGDLPTEERSGASPLGTFPKLDQPVF